MSLLDLLISLPCDWTGDRNQVRHRDLWIGEMEIQLSNDIFGWNGLNSKSTIELNACRRKTAKWCIMLIIGESSVACVRKWELRGVRC